MGDVWGVGDRGREARTSVITTMTIIKIERGYTVNSFMHLVLLVG